MGLMRKLKINTKEQQKIVDINEKFTEEIVLKHNRMFHLKELVKEEQTKNTTGRKNK